MQRITNYYCRVLTVIAMGLSVPAFGAVLTFDQGQGAGAVVVDQAYGDRITSTSMGGFNYGAAGGFTPNVEVSYAPTDGGLTIYPAGYGDLFQALAYDPDGGGPISITLTADPGFTVSLTSFLLAGSPNTDYDLPLLEVLTGNTVLYSSTFVPIEGDFIGPMHTTFANGFRGFTGYTAETLTIRVNQQALGGASDNIGIDNITFSQTGDPVNPIPEPASVFLLAGGLGLVAWKRRSRLRT